MKLFWLTAGAVAGNILVSRMLLRGDKAPLKNLSGTPAAIAVDAAGVAVGLTLAMAVVGK
jgi:hypothetical protein